MARRFGSFLILVGLGLGAFFYFSIRSGKMDVSLLIGGLVCFAVGLVIRQLTKPAPVDSGRFRILRRKYDDNDHEDDS
jgi:sugar phosphate permease